MKSTLLLTALAALFTLSLAGDDKYDQPKYAGCKHLDADYYGKRNYCRGRRWVGRQVVAVPGMAEGKERQILAVPANAE
jgi:hypothetical protein